MNHFYMLYDENQIAKDNERASGEKGKTKLTIGRGEKNIIQILDHKVSR